MIYLKANAGIEIRQEDLVVTCLKSNFTGGVFTSFGRIRGYRQRDRREVRGEIDRFFKQEQIGRDGIVLGIPRGDAILRYLDLPREVEDNLKQVVLYQVQAYEPTEEEKFYYDYVRLPSKQPSKKLQVLLVMVRKSILDEHLAVLGELGLRPSSVSVGSVALANIFLGPRNGLNGKTWVLADLKPDGIEIMILRNGSLLCTHERPRPDGASWKDLLLGGVEVAAGKARLGPGDTIENIILSGEEADAVRKEILEEVPDCELIGGRIPFEIPAKCRPHLEEGAVSLGLAYSGLVRRPAMKVNLLPWELRVHRTRWAYAPTAALALIIAVLLTGFGFRQIVQQRILIRQLDQEIASIKSRVDRVQKIRNQADALEKKILYVEGLVRNRDKNLEILQELTTVLPSNTFLTSYNYNDGTIQIAGISASSPDLIPLLEKSPLLKEVEQRGTVFKDPRSGKDRFTFVAKSER